MIFFSRIFIWSAFSALCYGKCLEGWDEFQGKCVKLFGSAEQVSWFHSRDHCASIGAYLARIDNAEMNEWVRK